MKNKVDQDYSVVIPAFNAQDTLGEAIESLLRQEIPPRQIIVVDDGSTDKTAEVAYSFAAVVKLVTQENRGVGAATNVGMRAVQTPLMAFLDADDIWLSRKAVLQLEQLQRCPELAGLCARAQTFKGPVAVPVMGSVSDLWSRTTLMIRTHSARIIGDMIDPPGGRGDTVDWLARGKDAGLRIELLPEVLAWRRIRPGSLSYGRDMEKDKGYLLIAKRALDRKRNIANKADPETA